MWTFTARTNLFHPHHSSLQGILKQEGTTFANKIKISKKNQKFSLSLFFIPLKKPYQQSSILSSIPAIEFLKFILSN
jgi:hypothetical protein